MDFFWVEVQAGGCSPKNLPATAGVLLKINLNGTSDPPVQEKIFSGQAVSYMWY